jgi:hypothetical protein
VEVAMARPPNAAELVERQDGSALAKKRLRLFLETIAGKLTVAEACGELGVNEAAFHRMRSRWLAESVEGLEPRKTGPRPRERTLSAAEGEQLSEENVRLERELKASSVREELGMVMPGVLKKTTRRSKPRKRRTGTESRRE